MTEVKTSTASVRLSARQRRVLQELAHMRVPREDAWLSTTRLAQLTGCTEVQADASLIRLFARYLVDTDEERPRSGWVDVWRITDAGRDALT